jgi:hypothetical protein
MHTRLVIVAVATALSGCLYGPESANEGPAQHEQRAGVVASAALPLISEGESYSAYIDVEGGVAPYSWRVAAGALPAGLTLDGSTGRVYGSTAAIGRHDLDIAVVDATGRQTLSRLRLDVIEADSPIPAPRDATRETRRALSTVTTQGDLHGLLDLIEATPDGHWVQASLNLYADVWTPTALRPRDSNNGVPTPAKIIGAWSGFAWDSNRGDLILYGGGHANYPGNDVYRWRGTTRRWERASLPSEVAKDTLYNYAAVDGVANAPSSAHTYDNNIFLPLADRLLVLGGAAYNNGGAFLTADGTTSRRTGPYLWDPNRADGNKVGGSTGSHVKRVAPYPEIVGGQMWQNRELWRNQVGNPALPNRHVEGCTGYAEEGGKDVVYVAAMSGGGTAKNLYRYVVNDVSRPDLDTWTRVGGYWDAPQGQTACTYDPQRKLFVRLGGSVRPFLVWNLNTPGSTNYETGIQFTDVDGDFTTRLANGGINIKNCGFDYAPGLDRFALWCGGSDVWLLSPSTGSSVTGWVLERQHTPTGTSPAAGTGTGILGKWKFIPDLGIFMALQDGTAGNIWIYKPAGWTRPGGTGNARPEVSLTSPTSGQAFAAGSDVPLEAQATDADGSISRVDFYAGTTLIGSASVAPWRFTWVDAPIGAHNLSATAFDDQGAQRTSSAATITVVAGDSGTLVLQGGLDGYAGAADAYLSTYAKSSNYGSSASLYEQSGSYTSLLRFAVFQREGGPVPDDAVITSARLSVYKYSSYDLVLAVHRLLCDWSEVQATWSLCRSGVPWSAAGATAAGFDYAVTADASAVVGWSAGWAEFDVTLALNQMRDSGQNFGWRMRRTGGDNANLKRFYTKESIVNASLRPKLHLTYYVP